MTSQLRRAGHRWTALRLGVQDCLLFTLAALFALGLGLTTREFAHRQWAWIALPGYAAAALAAPWAGRHGAQARAWLTIAVICVTAVLPLILQVHLRAGGDVESAQPEVAVIERTGVLLSRGVSPYQSWVDHGQLINPVPGKPSWFAMFPYLPLMAAFGLPAAWTHATRAVSDARLSLTIVTFAVSALALRWALVPSATKVRLAQVLLALPTGALFLATGGDDMPVLAFLALGLVGLTRGRWLMAGIGFGVAAALKLTAWPLVLALLTVGLLRQGRGARRAVAMSLCIVTLTLIPAIMHSRLAFITNVLAYPLGLTQIRSPAASAFPGRTLIEIAPTATHALLPLFLGCAAAGMWRLARSATLLTIPTATMVTTVLMSAAVCWSPASRAGYLIYPLNFAMWARHLRTEAA